MSSFSFFSSLLFVLPHSHLFSPAFRQLHATCFSQQQLIGVVTHFFTGRLQIVIKILLVKLSVVAIFLLGQSISRSHTQTYKHAFSHIILMRLLLLLFFCLPPPILRLILSRIGSFALCQSNCVHRWQGLWTPAKQPCGRIWIFASFFSSDLGEKSTFHVCDGARVESLTVGATKAQGVKYSRDLPSFKDQQP